MSRIFRILALVFMLCMSVSAFGQDLKVFRKFGNLVPHSSTVTERSESSILIYKQRGIVFHVLRHTDVVMDVVVFQPAISPIPPSCSGSAGSVFPGVGVYCVTMGMSMAQVRLSPYLKNARVIMEDGKGAVYDLGSQTMLVVSASDGKVSQLDVHGPFKTAEGITESCSVAQIQAVYGSPDEYYDIEWRVIPHPWSGVAVILPLLGMGTGLVLRWVRPRMPETSCGVASMVAFGAIGLTIATSAYLVVLLIPTGVGVSQSWYRLLVGALIGGGSVLVLELLPRRLPGVFGYVATLVAMLIVALVVDEVVRLVHPLPVGPSALGHLMMLNGPFVVAMFVGAGIKRRA